MAWPDIDRSVHDLMGTVARLDGVNDNAKQRLLAELVELDSAIHDQISRPIVVAPPPKQPPLRDALLGLILLAAFVVVAFFLGVLFAQWRS